jgi:hypothetical protein
MPISTLVTTVGASDANAYVTLAVANQYHLDRSPASADWTDATDDVKNKAILFATKLLDSLVEWSGRVIDDTQALLWPRTGMIKRSGYYVDSDVIPTELQEATAEYAAQLISGDRAADSDVETQGITALKAGPVMLQFKDSVAAKAVPDAVIYFLPREWYWKINGTMSSTRELIRA